MSGQAVVPPVKAGAALYERVAAALRERILRELSAGDAIEPELVLAEQLNVSRVTLRRGVQLLIDEGLLVRRQGIGTFVAAPRMSYPLLGLHSTRDIGEAHDLKPVVEIIESSVVEADDKERKHLRLKPGAKVLRFVRVDRIRNVPVAVAQCALPSNIAEDVTAEELAHSSTYELVEKKRGTRVTRAHQVMRADAASPLIAELLHITEGDPVLVLERVTFDDADQVIELGTVTYRHDLMECSIELTRQPSGRHETNTHVALRPQQPSPRRSR
jgi:GntR family transcriptional regulator